MRTRELDYELPAELIAQSPLEPRDAARLLVVGDTRAGPPEPIHARVRDLPSYLDEGDLVVINTTRVLPARVPITRRTGGSGEVLLLEDRGSGWWEALCRPSRKLAEGSRVGSSGGHLSFEIGADLGDGRRLVRPEVSGASGSRGSGCGETALLAALDADGEMPLPPYIHEPLCEAERYQTTFARRAASAAAPTAGLHLTPGLLDELRRGGVGVAEVELVVGLDTFRPVTTEVLEDHPIHTEHYRVPEESWHDVGVTRTHGGRVVAVGTTTTRALEAVAHSGDLSGRTDLFITPGFTFRVVDRMMTNFHLPRSSLLAMVEAFAGPQWREVYRIGVDQQYRFLSFGDAMLLDRVDPPPVRNAAGTPITGSPK